jgi:hypothetical protein
MANSSRVTLARGGNILNVHNIHALINTVYLIVFLNRHVNMKRSTTLFQTVSKFRITL